MGSCVAECVEHTQPHANCVSPTPIHVFDANTRGRHSPSFLLGCGRADYHALPGRGYRLRNAHPAFEKPDEHWHFAFAMYLVQTGQLPVQTLESRDHLAEQEGSQPPLYYATLALLLRISGLTNLEPGYDQLTEVNPYYGGRPGAWRDNGNQFVHTPCRDDTCNRTMAAVYVGRGLSLAWAVVAMAAGAYALQLVFPTQPALGGLTTAFVAFNPQFLHIASSVSNDAATVAMTAVTFALLASWLRAFFQEATLHRGADYHPPLPGLYPLSLALGVAAGLATLAKPSGLSIALLAGVS